MKLAAAKDVNESHFLQYTSVSAKWDSTAHAAEPTKAHVLPATLPLNQ